jgi:hypothetical protein
MDTSVCKGKHGTEGHCRAHIILVHERKLCQSKRISDSTGDATSIFDDNRFLIIGLIIVLSITVWNSRNSIYPPPKGYARFSDYGLSFLYPDDLNMWQVALNDDGSVVLDESRTVSENWGDIGWNSGNVDHERPGREGYFQEFSVMWLATNAPELGYELNLYYTMQRVTNQIRNREINIT